jgi:hypothetical protein
VTTYAIVTTNGGALACFVRSRARVTLTNRSKYDYWPSQTAIRWDISQRFR